eukprot:NODE_1437_length_1056_cov_1.101358.p1 type:complete len:114 gc:universal NODE_1437_length_1056_cov_1.101358:630-289(-)
MLKNTNIISPPPEQVYKIGQTIPIMIKTKVSPITAKKASIAIKCPNYENVIFKGSFNQMFNLMYFFRYGKKTFEKNVLITKEMKGKCVMTLTIRCFGIHYCGSNDKRVTFNVE